MQPKALSQARTSLTTCIRSHRDLVGLYLMRALVAGEEGNQALEKIAQSHPDRGGGRPSPARREGGDHSAEADYRQVLKLKPSDDLRYVLLTNRGLMRLQSNRLDEAVVDLEAAIRLKPSLYQAHATLAQVYQRQGRLDAAAASFDRAIACHPEPIVAAGLYRSRALLHAYRSDITPDQRKAAIRDLEEAIRQEPDKAQKVRDHVDRAKLFFAGGQSQEALAACDAALALAPRRRRGPSRADLGPDGAEAVRRGAHLGRRLHRARQALGRDLRDPRPGPRGAAELHRGGRRLQRALELTPDPRAGPSGAGC